MGSEGGKKMTSQLEAIVRRLIAMTKTPGTALQQREFTAYGVTVCEVTYEPLTGEFAAHRAHQEETTVFDNLDLAAIEIYGCLYDFANTF